MLPHAPLSQFADDGRVSIRLADALGFEHHLTGSVAGVDLDPNRTWLVAARPALFPHPHQRAHAALVSGPTRLDATAQPRLLLRHLLVERRPRHFLVGEPRLLFGDERHVVARPRRQPAAVELDDSGSDALKKRAVVRHEDD